MGLVGMPAHAPDHFRQRHYDVFVSYKREDDAARAVLVDALEAAGYAVFWDGKLNHDDWKRELRDEINNCSMVVCLWSAAAAASENVKAEAYHAFGTNKLLSAPIETDAVVPAYFKATNLHPFDGWADDSRRPAQLAKILATLERVASAPHRKSAEPHVPVIPVELGDLPGAPIRLVGREAELQVLRNAWASTAPTKINAVVLHALGGAGKSAVLRTFVNELLAAGGGGAERIYGWSAETQGADGRRGGDRQDFVGTALGDFGFTGTLPKDPRARAWELSKLVQRQRVLLLLDGLEPLQDPPGVNAGHLTDKGVAELVKKLADQNAGLLVLTTRQEVTELAGRGSLVVDLSLNHLSDAAGAELLVDLGVRGQQRELESAVRELDGHALSVTLLGGFLTEVCGSDIRRRAEFDFGNVVLTEAEALALASDKTILPARRVAKVMEGYLAQFEKLARDRGSAGRGGPERALLHLLGLFDRPADGAAVAAILETRIPGLTDELFVDSVISPKSWWLFKSRKVEVRELSADERDGRLREAKNRLRKLHILSKPNPRDPRELDAHPMVRSFFAGRLAATAPEAAAAAHAILFHHYAAAAPDLPATLDEMKPLFFAVQHGVKTGRVQDVFDEVFWRRLMRGNELYLLRAVDLDGAAPDDRTAGAYGPYLATLGHFFAQPWHTPHPSLDLDTQAWLLSSAAFALRALRRLDTSLEPQMALLRLSDAHEVPIRAARASANTAETLMTLGRLEEAVRTFQSAVAHADRSDDWFTRHLLHAELGAALFASGKLDEATAQFAEAEQIQAENQPFLPQLYSLRGYQFGDLFLARGEIEEALGRGRFQLEICQRFHGEGVTLVDRALAHLLIGRAEDALGRAEPAAYFLDRAVADLRRSGSLDLMPLALLARAAHVRRRAAADEPHNLQTLRADLAEVYDIVGDDMRLYRTDLALETARFALDVPAARDIRAAVRHLDEAARLIEATGYHRRTRELAKLRQRLEQ